MLSSSFTSVYSNDQFRKDSIIIVLIIVLPLLIYIHNIVPNVKIYQNDYFTWESNYYQSLQALFWVLSMKIVFVLTYGLWFLTCKHWWRYVILIPFIFFCAQVFSVLNDDFYFVDKPDLLYGLVISLPIVVLIIIISKKLKYYFKMKLLDGELDQELDSILTNISNCNHTKYRDIKKKFNELKQNKNSMKTDIYLSKLIELKKRLS